MFGWLFGNDDSPTDKDNTKKKDSGIFGIDWDGDGEVSELDDFMTIDMFSGDDDK